MNSNSLFILAGIGVVAGAIAGSIGIFAFFTGVALGIALCDDEKAAATPKELERGDDI